jgi:L-ascorbate metabolism protein UlaG (beta-lactamase superfamily)
MPKSISVIIFSLIFFIISLNGQSTTPILNIHYLGHSSFVLLFDNGVSLVTDYGKENAWVDWGWDSPISDIGNLIPDILTYSHQHDDHFDPNRIPPGFKYILSNHAELYYKGIYIRPVRTCESDIDIESNTSFIIEYKGKNICHLGDAQAQIMNIENEQVRKHIKSIFPEKIDILFMTIEGKKQFIPQVEIFLNQLNPNSAILMHYWSVEYLNDCIQYLNEKNKSGGQYMIKHIEAESYIPIFREKDHTIEIITLNRGPF